MEKITTEEIFAGVKTGYAILQIMDTSDYQYEMFASMNELKAMGKKPVPEHYELVYTGNLSSIPGNSSSVPGSMMTLLQYLYHKFNIDAPGDYTGRSLSVGDVIAVKDNDAVQFWFVDSIGFEQLNDFD